MRHWEIASPDPDRIVLTWSGDTATTQSVTWRTDTSITEAFAEIAPSLAAPRFDLKAKRLTAITEKFEVPGSDRTAHCHSAVFRDLEPDTRYVYRVGDGGQRWSEWIEFRTAKEEAAPFTFLYFGDAQNAVLSHWSRVIRAAYRQAPHAAFSIHAGDLINSAHRDREWAEWFKAGGWIHSSVPSIPVAGNHEYGGTPDGGGSQLALQWRPQFTLPVVSGLPDHLAETVYTLDYQGVRVIALNTNRDVEAQAVWLDSVLSENESAWTVVTSHYPIFSSGSGRDNPRARELLKPIIDKYQVDLLLQGHDHTYARGHVPVRMSDGETGPTKVKSLYINSVSGPKMYNFRENGWKVYEPDGVELDRKAENTQFFQVIDVDGNRLSYRAFTADGQLYDAFRLLKDTEGNKTLQPWKEDLGPERSFDNTPPYNLGGL